MPQGRELKSICASLMLRVPPGLTLDAGLGKTERGGASPATSVFVLCKIQEIGNDAVFFTSTEI